MFKIDLKYFPNNNIGVSNDEPKKIPVINKKDGFTFKFRAGK
jgi:hypothetical protein